MKPERRNHNRVNPKDMSAEILSIPYSESETSLTGKILDISRTGIRIKLNKTLGKSINDKLKITMLLPESGTPVTVHGVLKHLHSDKEYGVHYTHHIDGSIDDMLFECVKLSDSTILIKSL